MTTETDTKINEVKQQENEPKSKIDETPDNEDESSKKR